jgi:hypothetical protein
LSVTFILGYVALSHSPSNCSLLNAGFSNTKAIGTFVSNRTGVQDRPPDNDSKLFSATSFDRFWPAEDKPAPFARVEGLPPRSNLDTGNDYLTSRVA